MADWKEQLRKKAKTIGMALPETQSPENIKEESKNFYDDQKYARAPYNFVPLNSSEIVVSAEYPSPPSFGQYHKDKITGYIECDLETRTPLYIRGTLDSKQVQDNLETKQVSNFFSPANKIRIPGSSLRGMIRSIVEIASWSKFQFFDDKNLYYRAMADLCTDLREKYVKKLTTYDNNRRCAAYKMSAGYLRTDNGMDYYIVPAQHRDEGQFKKIKKFKAKELCRKKGYTYKEFTFYKLDEGSLVVSGSMPNKKNDWLIFPKDNSQDVKKIPVESIDIESYKKDKNRYKEADLINKLRKYGEVPCFYVKWQNNPKRVSFGHTPMFRVAYEQAISDHITPEKLINSNQTDIPEIIFGKEPDFAGRVFFEDAESLVKNCYLSEKEEFVPHILSGPKPTTFQHYLTQNEKKIDRKGKKIFGLNHYETEKCKIRGYKLYWHKKNEKWQAVLEFKEKDWNSFLRSEDIQKTIFDKAFSPYKDKIRIDLNKIDIENNKDAYRKLLDFVFLKNKGNENTQHTRIRPVRSNVSFKFRVRFENLSNVELGAMLFALNLPERCCHKLGMGKPLGFGTVKIKPELFTSERSKRYSSLFTNSQETVSWNTEEYLQSDIKKYIVAFENYIINALDERKPRKSLWELQRMKKLAILLNFDDNANIENWNHITDYMQIQPKNDFRERNILPEPGICTGQLLRL